MVSEGGSGPPVRPKSAGRRVLGLDKLRRELETKQQGHDAAIRLRSYFSDVAPSVTDEHVKNECRHVYNILKHNTDPEDAEVEEQLVPQLMTLADDMLDSLLGGSEYEEYTLEAQAEGGDVFQWGDMGRGSCAGLDTESPTPMRLIELTEKKVVEITSGPEHACARTLNGDIYTWGWGGNGQLGHGDLTSISLPRRLQQLNGVCKIACGGSHTLALTLKGEVYTWGTGACVGPNGNGEDAKRRREPRIVWGLKNEHVVNVACGASHSLALTENSEVFCWGEVIPEPGNSAILSAPKRVSGLPYSISSLQAGHGFCAALTTNGELYTWGWGKAGRLGHGNELDKKSPERVGGALKREVVIDVKCGSGHTLCLTETGRLFSYGLGHCGQLGHGRASNELAPCRVEDINEDANKCVSIATGDRHSMWTLEDGAMQICGYNACSVVADRVVGARVEKMIPENLARPTNVTEMSGRRVLGMAGGRSFALVVCAERADAYAKNCEAFGNGVVKGLAGETARFTIQARDVQGDKIKEGGDRFQVKVYSTLLDEEETNRTVRIRDNADGTYGVSYCPKHAKNYYVEVTLNGAPIRGSPYHVPVLPNDVAAMQCHAEGPGVSGGKAGRLINFKIFSRDAYGNAVPAKGLQFVVCLHGPCDLKGMVKDNNDGTYTASYKADIAGKYTMHVQLLGSNISNSPMDEVYIVPGTAHPGSCVLSQEGSLECMEKSKQLVLVFTKDEYGNNLTSGGQGYTAVLHDTKSDKKVDCTSIEDQGNGSHEIHFTPPHASTYELRVYLWGQPVKNSPLKVIARPRTPEPEPDPEPEPVAKEPSLEEMTKYHCAKIVKSNAIPFDYKVRKTHEEKFTMVKQRSANSMRVPSTPGKEPSDGVSLPRWNSMGNNLGQNNNGAAVNTNMTSVPPSPKPRASLPTIVVKDSAKSDSKTKRVEVPKTGASSSTAARSRANSVPNLQHVSSRINTGRGYNTGAASEKKKADVPSVPTQSKSRETSASRRPSVTGKASARSAPTSPREKKGFVVKPAKAARPPPFTLTVDEYALV